MLAPSGREVVIVEIYDGIGEALVRWPPVEFAQFRLSQLRSIGVNP